MAEHKVPQDVEAEDKLIGPYVPISRSGGRFRRFFLG